MIGLNTYEAALAGIEASMQAAMPHRVVQRSLVIDPVNHDPADLAKGVICLVAGGGGQFANYRGREGQLGHAKLGVVAFVKVPEDSAPVAVETAELAVLADVLQRIGLVAGPISLSQDLGLGQRRYKLLASGLDQRIDCDEVARAVRETAALHKLTVVPLDRDKGN